MDQRVQQDIEAIISHQYDHGADLWSTPDHKLLKGAPFTTLESPLYLLELGMSREENLLKETAALIFQGWREDGRFKISPSGGIYPCHTALALRTLCALGYTRDQRLQQTFHYFLATQEADGGWKCNKYSFGRGPETHFSTPMTTLTVLDAFRYTHDREQMKSLSKQANFCLLIGRSVSQSVPVIMGWVHYLCRQNIPLEDTIFFIICMSCLFILLLEKTHDFWRLCSSLNRKFKMAMSS